MKIERLYVNCKDNMQVFNVIDTDDIHLIQQQQERLIMFADEFANESSITRAYALGYPLQDWELCAAIMLANGSYYGIYFSEIERLTMDNNLFMMGCIQLNPVVIPRKRNVEIRHRPAAATSFHITPYDIGCLKETKGEYNLRLLFNRYNEIVIHGHEVVGFIRFPIEQN